jgi:hypothetical protein
MSFWTAIVAIVAIMAFANMRRERYRARHPLAGLHDQAAPPPSPALEREVTELRRRIEVLERIVTDERDTRRLAQDIEALREH